MSAKSQMGGTALLPSRQSYLPLKLNAGGVMPIIFASTFLILPVQISQFVSNTSVKEFLLLFKSTF